MPSGLRFPIRSLVSLCALLSCGARVHAASVDLPAVEDVVETKIAGGSATTGWPAVVIVIQNFPGGGLPCTGFVIARNWVLTPAYCVADATVPGQIIVGFGNDFSGPFDPDWYLVEAAEIRIHPQWDPAVFQGFDYNAALVRLPQPAPVDPLNVDLGPRGVADIGKRGTVVGFGATGPSFTTAGIKRAATMQIDAIDGTFLIAEGATPNACGGDGGAPLHHPATKAVIAMTIAFMGADCNMGTLFNRMDTIAPWLAANVTVCPPGVECSNLVKDGFEDPAE